MTLNKAIDLFIMLFRGKKGGLMMILLSIKNQSRDR